MDTLDIDGVQFVKAGRAAKDAGYTPDYVGQLCRGGKIESRFIGRTWYIRDGVLEEYKREKFRQNANKTTKDIKKQLQGQDEHTTHRSSYVPVYRKNVLNADITYSSDETTTHIPTTKSILHEENVVPERKIKQQNEEIQEEKELRQAENVNVPSTSSYIPIRVIKTTPGVSKNKMSNPKTIQRDVATSTESKSKDFTSYKEEVVKEDYALPTPSRILPTLVSIMGLIIIVGALFVQNIWVYQIEGGVTGTLFFDASFNIASVTTVFESLME